MSVRAPRFLPAVLLGVLLALGTSLGVAAGPAAAQPVVARSVTSQSVTALAQEQTAPGVDLPQAPTEADKENAKSKIVVGVVAVLLLGAVVWGNRIRAKRKKK
ncbi:hypothetical protein [Actinokineospora globicatena]|uniref:LPXTG-motif cell wall anchor domain-containing protein n=1 Tax=Actinokineospora globicatena TaxID=103729 RepID=A0A9W6QSK3_9PSEU|nr:hypothetical protein [Actinokineospora globicatena]GLW95415.1 hypothetical protein Aglo03_62310 [Actinokineospora globicatena]